MTKKEIRKQVLADLKNILPEEKASQERALQNLLFQSTIWRQAETISLTISMDHEVSTEEIINKGNAMGKRIVIPRCEPESRSMSFYPFVDRSTLIRSSFGVLEPDPHANTPVNPGAIDLIIVPGIAFSPAGFRIGHGGGYYDRFLAKHPAITTVSLVLQEQLIRKIPSEPHDIAVQYLIQHEKESSK